MATLWPMPALVDNHVEEILLQFPPDDPTALVCKGWRRLVSGHGFRHRFREVHGTAPMLGFLRQRGAHFHFQPTTSFGPRFAHAGDPKFTVCWAVDARHGCILINRYSWHRHEQGDFLVWDPIRGNLRTLPRPQHLLSCCTKM